MFGSCESYDSDPRWAEVLEASATITTSYQLFPTHVVSRLVS